MYFYIALFWRPWRQDWITAITESLFLETSTGFFIKSGKKYFYLLNKIYINDGMQYANYENLHF